MIPEWFTPDLGRHPADCLCDWCAELRAAVEEMPNLEMPNLDKHIANLMAAKEQGKASALEAGRQRAEKLIQDERDRRARGAEILRREHEAALAIEAADCTCRPPAWNPGSPNWYAHDTGCPMRARLCSQKAREIEEKHRGSAGQGSPPQPEDPADRIRRELMSPLGLPESKLPQYDTVPAGGCRECFGPAEPGRTLCWYCSRRQELARESAEHGAAEPEGRVCTVCGGSHRKREETAVVLVAIGLCLILSGIFTVPAVALLGVLLVGVAVVSVVKG